MTHPKFAFQNLRLLLALAAVLLAAGCATTEPENASSRPWGYRSGYDVGMPAMINEGR